MNGFVDRRAHARAHENVRPRGRQGRGREIRTGRWPGAHPEALLVHNKAVATAARPGVAAIGRGAAAVAVGRRRPRSPY